jgi:eukaryotic-like serine/threonine-protein kinase
MTAPAPIGHEFLALQEVLAGRYSIERELGRGGMGIVLLARDVALDRPVAIKLLPPHLAANREARDRFLQEARMAAGLSHPNIVPIHLVEARGDLVFFVMGYVDGETLRERVERAGPLSPRLALKLLQEVAWALAYAHQRGLIHRDVKPDNIMIERATERALVTDFGIALGERPGEGARPDGVVIGTARYMSPEQACGEPVDARSDLYSLGATFFYALTGRAPFEGTTVPAILAKQVSEPAPLVRAVRPEVPDKVASVINRCLQKEPKKRFQTGDDLARVVGEVRGRDFRAPPLVRAFTRNAQVSTMVLIAMMLAGQSVTVAKTGVTVSLGGPGIIGVILLCQLVFVARRLLKDGYGFNDIRAALLAEAQVQAEEAEVMKQRRFFKRLDTFWYKMWAGWFGRMFFKVAGCRLRAPAGPATASVERTELLLERSALAAYNALPDVERRQTGDVPRVLERLEAGAEALRAKGDTGERLTETVAALERLRLALFRLRAREGSVGDLTLALERARAIGEHVDARLEAAREVESLLE